MKVRHLVVVLALLLAACSSGSDHTAARPTTTTVPSTGQPTTSTTTPTNVTVAALVGSWRPVSIAGYNRPLTDPPLSSAPTLRFDRLGSVSGSDGCNIIGGSYRLGRGGGILFTDVALTKARCLSTPEPPEPLNKTARIDIRNGRLTFLASDGHELAQYERATVTAKIVLPSTMMTAGSSMTGHVIVENNTGQPLHVTGCISLFGVALSNSKIHQDSAFRACAQPFTIPIGESSYRVTIYATYSACSETGQPQGADPVCLPNNGIPPLPPGKYEATLVQSSVIVPIPPQIVVRITARR